MAEEPEINSDELEPYEPDPWERQPDEPDRAFASFVAYRDQPSGTRTVANAAKSRGRSTSTLWEMAQKWKWRERVVAWDMENDRVARRQREEAQAAANQRHAAAGGTAVGKALTRLVGRGEEGEPGFIPALDEADLDAQDVARLLRVGVAVERLALGLATSLTGHENSIPKQEAQRVYAVQAEVALDMLPEDQHEVYLARVRAAAA